MVLKPDVGQRGSGVVVARGPEQVAAFLEAVPGPAIVQQFVAGPELGIFYVRLPDEERGRIFSITDKQLTTVVGDGERNLETLILGDARAVFMAPTFLARFEDSLEEVPAAGERVRLTELGTHCSGATFFDGWEHCSPELEAAVDRHRQKLRRVLLRPLRFPGAFLRAFPPRRRPPGARAQRGHLRSHPHLRPEQRGFRRLGGPCASSGASAFAIGAQNARAAIGRPASPDCGGWCASPGGTAPPSAPRDAA